MKRKDNRSFIQRNSEEIFVPRVTVSNVLEKRLLKSEKNYYDLRRDKLYPPNNPLSYEEYTKVFGYFPCDEEFLKTLKNYE